MKRWVYVRIKMSVGISPWDWDCIGGVAMLSPVSVGQVFHTIDNAQVSTFVALPEVDGMKR